MNPHSSNATSRGRRPWPATGGVLVRILLAWATCLPAVAVLHAAEILPIQSDVFRERVNARGALGLPLTSQVGVPAGSDGRAPASGSETESGSFNEASPGQFRGWAPYSGGPVPWD